MKKILFFLLILALIAAIILGFPKYKKYRYENSLKSGDQAFKLKDFKQAEFFYLKALKLYPKNVLLLENLSKLYLADKKLKKSLKSLNKALDLEPKNADIYYLKGNVYLAMDTKDWDNALKSYDRALELNPELKQARRKLLDIMQKENKFDDAVRILKKRTYGVSKNSIDYLLLYSILNQRKKENEAVGALEEALKLKKPPRRVFFYLLAHYEKKGNQEKINNLLKNFMEKHSSDLNAYNAVSAYYEKKKEFKKAEFVLKKAVKVFSNGVVPQFLLANLYLRQKRFQDALKIVEESLQIDPNCPQAYLIMGKICYEMKDWARSETELSRCIAIYEKQPLALNMLAWLYLTAPKNCPQYKPKKALILSRKTVALSPNNMSFIDTLARALYANGKYKKSALTYKKNLRRKKVRRKIKSYSYYGISICFYRSGKLQEASKMLELALDNKFSDVNLINQDMDISLIKNNNRVKEILNNEQ